MTRSRLLVVRSTASFLFLVLSLIGVEQGTAQNYQQVGETTISWSPDAGQNGADASIRVRIVYNAFMGEPTVKAMARVTKGSTVYYNGQRYTRAQVGEDAWEDIDFGSVNVEADIYQGHSRITTVRHTNLISMDVSGSPDWGEVFPGVGAERAKQIFRDGFQIRNIRLVGGIRVSGMGAVGNYVRAQAAEQEYSSAISDADRHFQQKNWDQARAAYSRAYQAKRTDYARQRIEEIDEIRIAERRAERERQEAAEAAEREAAAQEQATAQNSGAGQSGSSSSGSEGSGSASGSTSTEVDAAAQAEAERQAAAERAARQREIEEARRAAEERRRREREQAAARTRASMAAAGTATLMAGGTVGGYMSGEVFGMVLGMVEENFGFLFHVGTNEPALITGTEPTVENIMMEIGADVGISVLGTNLIMPYVGYSYTAETEGEGYTGWTGGVMGYLFNAFVYQAGMNFATGLDYYSLGLQIDL